MEDDIYDTFKSKWKKNIEDIINNAPSDYECLILHCVNAYEIDNMINMNEDYSLWKKNRWSQHIDFRKE